MTKTLEQKVPAARSESATADLSEAIELFVERQPGEVVRCVRVYGDKYRCNWSGRGEVGLAGRIRRSRFLKVAMVAGRLEVEDVTG